MSAIGTILTAMVVALSLPGCSSYRLQSDYDPEIDFAAFDAYAWLPPSGAATSPPAPAAAPWSMITDDLFNNRVRRAVDDHLAAKSLREVPEREADVLVTHHAGIAQKLQVNVDHFGYGHGWWSCHSGVYSDVWIDQYEEGTLMIDLIDAKTRQLVWRGTGSSGRLNTGTPQQREQHIRELVDAILEQYPPRP